MTVAQAARCALPKKRQRTCLLQLPASFGAAGTASTTSRTPGAPHTRLTVSNRGALSGHNSLYNASRVMPAGRPASAPKVRTPTALHGFSRRHSRRTNRRPASAAETNLSRRLKLHASGEPTAIRRHTPKAQPFNRPRVLARDQAMRPKHIEDRTKTHHNRKAVCYEPEKPSFSHLPLWTLQLSSAGSADHV